MHTAEFVFCLVLIALRTGPSIGQDSNGKDVVTITSVEASELGKLEISWELKAGTENVNEFRIQLEACPSSGSCYQGPMMYIKSQGLQGLFNSEIECQECRRYIVRVTAVDVERNDVGESGFYASFKLTDTDIADSHPTSEDIKVVKDIKEDIKDIKNIEFTKKEVKVSTEVPSDPAIDATETPEPTERRDDIGSTEEKKDLKDIFIYALTPLLAVLAIALAVLAICLVKQRSKQLEERSRPVRRMSINCAGNVSQLGGSVAYVAASEDRKSLLVAKNDDEVDRLSNKEVVANVDRKSLVAANESRKSLVAAN